MYTTQIIGHTDRIIIKSISDRHGVGPQQVATAYSQMKRGAYPQKHAPGWVRDLYLSVIEREKFHQR